MIIPDSILNFLSKRNNTQVTTIFIHHSDALPTLDIVDLTVMEEASQGFKTIGYNYYVKCLSVANDLWTGQVGRPLEDIPAAQYGMNTQGYAICIGGCYEPGAAPFNTAVSDHALKIAAAQILLVKSKCPNLKYLQGHRDVKPLMMQADHWLTDSEASADYGTACPGDSLYARLDDLRKLTGLGNAL